MTQPHSPKPPPVPRRRTRHRRRPGRRRGLAPPRGCPDGRRAPGPALRRAGRRGRRRAGGRVERDGPPRPPARRIRRHRELPEPAARHGPRGAAGDGLHREGGAHRLAGGPGRLLPGDVPRPRRHEDDQRARGRALQDGARGRPRRDVRVVRRHRRTGLGDQPRVGRHAPLRGDARPRAGLLRPQRRHDLRRRPPQGRGRSPRGRHVEEPRDRGQVEGRGDARGVSRQLPLQPDGRERAAIQRPDRAVRPVGRPRGDEQLVPRARARGRPLHGQERGAPLGPGEASHVRVHAARRQQGRERPRVSADPARAEPRPLHARHAELPRPEHREPGDRR